MSEEVNEVTTTSSEEASVETTAEDLNVEVEDSQESESDLEAVDTNESEESDEDGEEQEDGEEETEDKAPTKLTADERKAQLQKEIQDLANQRRALKESLEQELLATVQEELKKQKEEVPPYVEVDWDKFNAHVATELEEIDNLKFEGRAADALLKQRNLQKLYDQIEANEKLKADWTQAQEAKRQQQESNSQINQAIAQATELVRKAMKVDEGDWKLGEQWFLEKRRSDPLIDTQYREMVYTQGPTHALKWAYEYVMQNMGTKAKEEKLKREEGKKKAVGGNSTATPSNEKVPTSFNELMNLPQDRIIKLEKSNPKLFNKLINQKLK